MKIRKNIQGAISIFLILIMIPMFTFAGVIVDLSRMSSAQIVLSGASDLAMNAAMSDYNKVLKDVYGIFAMSGSDEELNDNLRRYFENSLSNIVDLETSDSYTRDYMNSLCSWFTTAGSESDADFDSLLQITDQSFNAKYVKGSQVSSVPVLKRQILEYMKYRAPVSMATTLLSKFGGFSGFSQQSKVLNNKVKYEKALSALEDPCMNAYQSIKTARDYQYTSSGSKDIQDYIGEYNAAVDSAKSNYKQISWIMVVLAQLEDNQCGTSFDSNGSVYNEIIAKAQEVADNDKKEFEEAAKAEADSKTDSTSSGEETPPPEYSPDWREIFYRQVTEIFNLESVKDKAGVNYCTFSEDGDLWTFQYYESDSNIKKFADDIKARSDQIDYGDCSKDTAKKVMQLQKDINDWVKENEDYIKVLLSVDAYFNSFSSEHSDAWNTIIGENDNIVAFIRGIYNKIIEVSNNVNKYTDTCTGRVNSLASATYSLMNTVYNDTHTQLLNYKSAVKNMETVIEGIETAEEAGNSWEESIDKVKDAGTKQTMMSDYKGSAELMKKAEAEKLNDNVLEINKEFFNGLEEKITGIEFCGNKLYNTSGDFISKYKKAKAVPDSIDSFEKKGDSIYSDKFKNPWGNDKAGESGFITILDDMQASKDENQKFFGYLCEICGNKEDADSSKGEEHTKNKDSLLEYGKTENAEKASGTDLLSGESKSLVQGDFLSGSIYEAILNSEENSEAIDKGPAKDIKDDDNEKVADNAGEMSDGASSFLEKLSNIATEGRDKTYLVEYMTKMFSCYTTNAVTSDMKQDKDGNIQNAEQYIEQTLSGIKLCPENNVYYGAECEYILWGDTNPENCIRNTKLLLFGIRFALNSIYAFTAPDIQSMTFQWAFAIAGWTGFGVPIVQTVLTLALSVAESVCDVTALCSGESVPIYKSASTWVMSPGNIVKEAIEDVGKKAAEVASEKVTNIFDKIQNCAYDAVDDMTKAVEDYIDKMIDDIKGQINASIITPLQNKIKGILNKIDQNWSDGSIVEKELNDFLDELNNSLGVDEDTIIHQCQKEAVKCVKEKTAIISSDIYNETVASTNKSIDEAVKKVNTSINDITNNINGKVDKIISEANKELKSKVDGYINSGEEKVKEKINSALTDYSTKIAGSFPENKDGTKGSNSTNAKSAMLSLTYKEYLYAFMMVGMLGKEENMVARTGQLIQLNMSQGLKEEDLGDENFNLTESYSMISMYACAEVGATFMGMFKQSTSENGETEYKLDYSLNGRTTNTITYNGITGY